jgi:hypothetical protein
MAKKPTLKEEMPVAAPVVVAPAPAPVLKFTTCRQCSNPGDCARRAKCAKGFK